jgi:thioredoxin-dependent peroxiredoxin
MAIQKGDKCPFFSLLNEEGDAVQFQNLIGTQKFVLFFYPKNHTTICTQEVCSFRDSYVEFEALGCAVFGISSDAVSSHFNFSSKHGLNYSLLSDSNNEVRTLFGVRASFFGSIPGRATYVVDERGIVQLAYASQFSADRHIRKALKVLAQI